MELILIVVFSVLMPIGILNFMEDYSNEYFEWREITIRTIIWFVLGLTILLPIVLLVEFYFFLQNNNVNFLNYQPFKKKE